VLDWDMCTQGDPLADLGLVLNYWSSRRDNPEWREIAAMPTWRGGFPEPGRGNRPLRPRAPASTSRRSAGIRCFAAFKLAVIIQQIYIRFVRGQTQDPALPPLLAAGARPRRQGARTGWIVQSMFERLLRRCASSQ